MGGMPQRPGMPPGPGMGGMPQRPGMPPGPGMGAGSGQPGGMPGGMPPRGPPQMMGGPPGGNYGRAPGGYPQQNQLGIQFLPVITGIIFHGIYFHASSCYNCSHRQFCTQNIEIYLRIPN